MGTTSRIIVVLIAISLFASCSEQKQPSLLQLAQIPVTIKAPGGAIEAIRALVKNGADVNQHDKQNYGFTALHYAAAKGNAQLVEYLLSKGAKVNARGQAVISGRTLKYGTPLHHVAGQEAKASPKSLIKVAELLLAAKAEINAQNATGETALHLAARGKNNNLASLLIEEGAAVNAINVYGQTPLILAVSAGVSEPMIKLLVEKKANPVLKDRHGSDALSIAKAKNNKRILALLTASL